MQIPDAGSDVFELMQKNSEGMRGSVPVWKILILIDPKVVI